MTRTVLGIFFTALMSFGQTPAELLQKAIYTDQTAGDPDAAIQIYRQVVATTPAQSPTGAQAQYRIAMLTLQKGDLPGASAEFAIMSSRYSENKTLIARLAGSLQAIHTAPTGQLANGRYRATRTGLEFSVPQNWKISYDGVSSDAGDMVGFVDPATPTIDYGVWTKPGQYSPEQISNGLRNSPANKKKANGGDFDFTPETIQTRMVGVTQGLSGVASYTQNNQKLFNYYVWVWTPKMHGVFLARDMSEKDLAQVQAKLDAMAASATLP